MQRSTTARIVSALALLLTLWLIWSRLHIVVFVNVPWWGMLLFAIVLFLILDYVIGSVFKKT